MTQSQMFAREDEWEPCTCPWGTVVGGKDSDNPATTTPEHCSCEVHRDEWATREQEKKDSRARAQWKPNRATRNIEAVRAARVAREAAQYEPPLSAPPVGGTVTEPIGHGQLCARIDARAAAAAREKGLFVYRWDERPRRAWSDDGTAGSQDNP